MREGKTALSQKTQLNTGLIERKTNQAEESIILAKSKEQSQEVLKKVILCRDSYFTVSLGNIH